MNQSFDFSRWWLLVAKHWYENQRKYTLSLLAIAGLLLAWFAFIIFINPFEPIDPGMQFGTYYFGLILLGCLYASLLFADLASRSKGINYLSVPASHLEKLLCALLYGVIIFFVVYTVIFYVVEVPMIKVSNVVAHAHWKKLLYRSGNFHEGEVINVFIMPNRPAGVPNIFFYFLLAYFAIQAAFILGSVYFPKFSFIKTVISLTLVCAFLAFLVGQVFHSMMPSGNFYHGITSYNFFTNDEYANGKIVQLPGWTNSVLEFIIQYAFAPIFWITTYFRLKEKEI
jgi:hypothetical protein